MKSFKILVISGVLSLSVGCAKWFDVNPSTEMKADVLFSTQSGFRDALIGVYSLMSERDAYGSELSMAYVDVLAQTYDNVRTTPAHPYVEAAAYNYTESGEENRQLRIWRQLYKAIVNVNLLIENADANKHVFSGYNYNLIKGEALALRAHLHFDLLRLFGNPPPGGLDHLAIPYVSAYTNIPVERSTSAGVIQKALKDLDDARELLKQADPFGPNLVDLEQATLSAGNRRARMNYFAATAVMARMFLYQGEKPNALEKAKEVIDSGLFPLFTSAGTVENEDYVFPTEHVFSLVIPDLKTRYADIFFPETIGSRVASELLINNTQLDQIFPAGLDTDYRNNWFETATSTSKRLSKYSYNTMIPMIKVSEMYLIAAESESDVAIAIDDYLNVLKIHRGLSPLDATTTTEAMRQQEIADEYRREFIGEGQLFYYYKRLNWQKLPTIPAFDNSDEVYIWPIPQLEIEFGHIH